VAGYASALEVLLVLHSGSPCARLVQVGVLAILAGVLASLVTPSVSEPQRCRGRDAACSANRSLPTSIKWRRSASFERDLNTGTDGWNLPPMAQVSGFTITRSSEVGGATGSYAAKIVSSGGNTGCSCPRMIFEDGFRYKAGREVWLRGSWYLPDPSALTWSRMMNLSAWRDDPSSDYYTGLVIEGRAGRMLVRTRRYDSTAGQRLIFPARRIPVGRWFTVVLHFELSPRNGRALNEWYVNGRLVGRNTVANMHNRRPMHVFQGGMPYFLNGVETTVYFDNAGLTDRRLLRARTAGR
jgi:hypothetical protein